MNKPNRLMRWESVTTPIEEVVVGPLAIGAAVLSIAIGNEAGKLAITAVPATALAYMGYSMLREGIDRLNSKPESETI